MCKKENQDSIVSEETVEYCKPEINFLGLILNKENFYWLYWVAACGDPIKSRQLWANNSAKTRRLCNPGSITSFM